MCVAMLIASEFMPVSLLTPIASDLGATDGMSFQQLAARMTGMSQQEYADMMLRGGRSPDGNRYTSEWESTSRG